MIQKNLNSGPWIDVECNQNKKGKRGQAWVLVNKQQGYVSIDCADGIYYRGWTWGREFETGKHFQSHL